jgi:aminopeptidase N
MSVLRMTREWLDTENGRGFFQNRISGYLKKYQYSNGQRRDLWREFSPSAADEAAGEEVARILDTWVTQPGYPIVDADASKTAGSGMWTLSVAQSRFLRHAPDSTPARIVPEATEEVWSIPMRIQYAFRPAVAGSPAKLRTLSVVVKQAKETVNLGTPDAATEKDELDHVKVNLGQFGFYRVRYSRKLLDLVGAAIASNSSAMLGDLDVAGVLEDYLSQSLNGYGDPVTALTLVDRFVRSSISSGAANASVAAAEAAAGVGRLASYPLWIAILQPLRQMRTRLQFEPFADSFDRLLRSWLSPLVPVVGWEEKPGDSLPATLLRETVLAAAVDAGVPEAVARARQIFVELKNSTAAKKQAAALAQYSQGVVQIVYQAGVKYGGADEYEFVLKR